MADNRKYYYLKLKESFFDGDSIVLLESMPDGILFSNILMKLYLKSLKNGGKLQLDEHIPYTAQMIATLTRHQIGTVERAIKVFLQLGLVEQLDGGLLYMTDIELMIGQSSTEGERFIFWQARSTDSAIRRICMGVMRSLSSTTSFALVMAAMILVISKSTSEPFLLMTFMRSCPLFPLHLAL